VVLEGVIDVRPLWAPQYAQHHQKYTIQARQPGGLELLDESTPDSTGGFAVRLSASIEPADVELTWRWEEKHEFVLFPVTIRNQSSGRTFHFRKLHNLYDSQKSDMLDAIADGRFDVANALLYELDRVLGKFDDTGQVIVAGHTMGDLSHAILQDLCVAADKYRQVRGRSRVTDQQLGLEREWRKTQFSAALRTTRAMRSLANALNAWANFSRQAYSRTRTWPDRAASDPQLFGRREAVAATEEANYQTWLLEDLDSVADSLRWLQGELRATGRWNRLSAARRQALEQVLLQDPRQIRMSQLVDLLSGLAALAQ
jgi:hypothetical protein